MSVLTDLQSAVVANTNAVNAAVFAFANASAPTAGVPEADVAIAAATVAADAARLAAAIPVATPPAA